jgi:hypothetical protein
MFVGSLIGNHLLFNFGTSGLIFMNVCIVIAVAMIITLLGDSGPYVLK